MALTGEKTFVGFGFGAIQSGLFLYEAYQSGNFGRMVVAEVMPDVVNAVREANGVFTVNIARESGVENAQVGAIEIENPSDDADRARLIDAVAAADEIATAVPSVRFYQSDGEGSIRAILAEGLRRKAVEGGRAVIYTAENDNHAAEKLQEAVMSAVPENERDAVAACVRFLNTVIGKMSGVVMDADEIRRQGLQPVTPKGERAFLVEAFNRILITRIDFDVPFARGLDVFEEKADLMPFEEAKLWGHNATHALAAYVGAAAGLQFITQLRDLPGAMDFLRTASVEESGASLAKKYAGVDPLFTQAGMAAFFDDLLVRMTNPYLRDTVARVGRDPARKLGWNDRLVGAMRLAHSYRLAAMHYAFGAAAALRRLDSDDTLEETLTALWEKDSPERGEMEAMLRLVADGQRALEAWIAAGHPDLTTVFDA